MRLLFILTFAILILISCSVSSEKEELTVTRQAAEFEPLDAMAVNMGGGGINCIGMQQPKFLSETLI